MARTGHRTGFLAFAAAAACTHAPATRRPLPEVVWPEPPAAPIVRLSALVPDPGAPPERAAWSSILRFVAGTEGRQAAASAFARPFGVAVLDDGTLVVADPDEGAVARVRLSGKLDRLRCRKRPWVAPMGVAPGPGGSVLVADGGAGAVVRVEPGGECRVLGEGALERPTGVVALGERIAVADPPRHEIVLLSAAGDVVARWGARGDGEGKLHFPTALAEAADGTVLVVDALNFRIARFSPRGEWLGAFGGSGDADGGLARPKGISVDGGGRIWVTDAQRDRVVVYSPDGRLEGALGAGGSEPGRFTMPSGIAARSGRLYVADSHNRRIQVFEILGGRP